MQLMKKMFRQRSVWNTGHMLEAAKSFAFSRSVTAKAMTMHYVSWIVLQWFSELLEHSFFAFKIQSLPSEQT